jgi:hypothetical protein
LGQTTSGPAVVERVEYTTNDYRPGCPGQQGWTARAGSRPLVRPMVRQARECARPLGRAVFGLPSLRERNDAAGEA